MKKNKLALVDIAGIVFRALCLLVSTFLGYNLALAFALVIGAGGIILVEEIFISVLGCSIVAIFQAMFEWGVQHSSVCFTIIAIAYIGGWFWFIYNLITGMVQNGKDEDNDAQAD